MTQTAKSRLFGLWLALAVLLSIAIGSAGFSLVERSFQIRSAEQAQGTLRLTVAGLRGALNRYEPLPSLIAEKPSIKALLSDTTNPDLASSVNLELKQIAEDVGASDIYVIDANGYTWAASNFDQTHSFVGLSYVYRPYFQQAIEGGLGRFFALGTASLKRGYYFSAPIRLQGQIAGVVTVKISVDALEADWRGADSEILVTDQFGIIFMSSRSDWHFQSLQPLQPATLDEIKAFRQYPIDQLGLLNLQRKPIGNQGAERFTIGVGGTEKHFVANAMAIPEAGWNVHILTPTAAARTQAITVIVIAVLVLLLTILVTAFLLLRRARMVERIAAQHAAQELLENRVAERTVDLNQANTQLLQEIEERKQAERQLRKTQSELVQAGKLAALGQMSAALSHEFNQPLAAVKTYADNAATYLDRNRIDEARDNVGRISQMADRMAAISKHLRNFARRPQEKIGPVPLLPIISDALAILSAKLRDRNANIVFDPPLKDIWIMGGRVRLQQVLVNLISNALDASTLDNPAHNGREPDIHLTIETTSDRVRIKVRDHGSGLAAETKSQIFDPFYTTKGPGEGLGLGLSISYNIIRDFGGRLLAENHPDGGAIFTIDLAAADQLTEEAAE
ncbi:ATP-binding protein [Pararhizobium sp. IMCC21322]|uniref:sensor histidine kinase n=1 Tax=Pararhizobium sp. IMCC21322 TaxID=3067903 RepID=UPI002741BF23|nr:ATP-binding protein [Pararhizobium sp. IMCC21322]